MEDELDYLDSLLDAPFKHQSVSSIQMIHLSIRF